TQLGTFLQQGGNIQSVRIRQGTFDRGYGCDPIAQFVEPFGNGVPNGAEALDRNTGTLQVLLASNFVHDLGDPVTSDTQLVIGNPAEFVWCADGRAATQVVEIGRASCRARV